MQIQSSTRYCKCPVPRLFGGMHTEVNEATGRLESGKATEGRAQVRRPVTRRMPQSREEDWPKHRRYLPDLSGTAVSRDEYDPTPWGVVAPPSCLDALIQLSYSPAYHLGGVPCAVSYPGEAWAGAFAGSCSGLSCFDIRAYCPLGPISLWQRRRGYRCLP